MAQELPPAAEKPRRTNYVLILMVVAVIFGVLIALPYLFRAKTPPRRAPPVTISTTNAVRGNIDQVQWGLGTVTAVYTAMISPRVDGQLMKVNYTEGQL